MSASPTATTTTMTAPARAFGTSVRQAYDQAVAGASGAVCGLYLDTELVHVGNVVTRDALAGLAIGGAIGFFLNAAGPFRDGAWFKLARAATWGALAGAVGGAVGLVLGEQVIDLIQGGLVGRALSWAVLGLGIGLSQGLAERSRQRLAFGLIGGGLGGFLGGLLFEALRQGMGNQYTLSQGIGIAILGAGLGLVLALVEQVLRRAWVVVLSGRQEGRVYLLSGTRSALGLNERAAVGLFGDPLVVRQHAEIEATPKGHVLHNLAPAGRTRVNGAAVDSSRPLSDGDRVELGQTMLLFRHK